MARTQPDVFIVESLEFEDEASRKEGEIIYRSLKMSGKDPIYHYVRTKKELAHFISEFGKSGYRYFHLSCHGNVDTFGLTLDTIDGDKLISLFGSALDSKRLFLSTCLATESKFAEKLFKNTLCTSLAGPVGAINFDDSAVFWTAFYHLMFKTNSEAMNRTDLLLNLGKAALVIGQEMRVFTRKTSTGFREHLLPPKDKRLQAEDVDQDI